MFKPFLIVSLLLLSMQAFSQTAPNAPSDHALLFQIIQDEFVLDSSTIKSASIIEEGNGVYKGLNVQLKPQAAALFTDMTKAGVGRRMNLIFNKVVISTATIQASLGDNFLISGISKQDAQAFLNILNANKPKPAEDSA